MQGIKDKDNRYSLFGESFRPGGYGEEYHKVWKCDGYNIRIDSDARKFPDSTS